MIVSDEYSRFHASAPGLSKGGEIGRPCFRLCEV
jgi:hypothetical protein